MSATSTLRKLNFIEVEKRILPNSCFSSHWKMFIQGNVKCTKEGESWCATKAKPACWAALVVCWVSSAPPALRDSEHHNLVSTTCALPFHRRSELRQPRDKSVQLWHSDSVQWHSRALWGGHWLKRGEKNKECCSGRHWAQELRLRGKHIWELHLILWWHQVVMPERLTWNGD